MKVTNLEKERLGLDSQIMTNEYDTEFKENFEKDLNDICEECKKEDESVHQNLILIGFKICKYCKNSKVIFPV